MSGVRLNKHIADSGYCARRKADELIAAGRVRVNGRIVTMLGTRIDPETDQVTVDDQPLPTASKFYLLFHKPAGLLTSRRSQNRAKTLYDILPKRYRSADPAGRLDQNSSGLLVLSNDGDFIHRLSHPGFHLSKIYEVRLDRPLADVDHKRLLSGVTLQPEGKLARMTDISAIPDLPAAYRMTLITGYNRQIRRSLELLKYKVRFLKRIAFGPFQLQDLPPGACRELTPAELALLDDPALASSSQPEKGQDGSQDKHWKAENNG